MMNKRCRDAISVIATLTVLWVALPSCSNNEAEAEPPIASANTPPVESKPKAQDKERPTNAKLFGEQMHKSGVGLTASEEQAALKAFLRVWSKHKPIYKSSFLGVRTFQNPLDAWVVQEVISEVAPDVIVEAGTANGGSALLWAMIQREVNPAGRVITIDIEDRREERAKQHPLARKRVDFLLGSSTAPQVVESVRSRVAGKKVLVLLDSLHTKEHIANELAAYAPMVPVGSYVIVQDTPLGGVAAIREFLAENDQFEVDRDRERFVLTNSMLGYLKRVR